MELVRGEWMVYKIAIASSDEIHIDETFGSAKKFFIYEIMDGQIQKVEERSVEESNWDLQDSISNGYNRNCSNECDCNLGVGSGCCGNERNIRKVEMLSDCRCVICSKIGVHIQKQFDKKAITTFDVNCAVKEALVKISSYYIKVDTHQSLREIAK